MPAAADRHDPAAPAMALPIHQNEATPRG